MQQTNVWAVVIAQHEAWKASWCKIKHDVSKFVGVFASVVALNESGTSQEDTLQKALDLYRVKQGKNQSFSFLYYWLILRELPRLSDNRDEVKKITQMKRPNMTESVDVDYSTIRAVESRHMSANT
jgi:hypothetical protein